MKKISVIASLTVINFAQLASPAAFTALCSRYYPDEIENSVLKVIVSDDWEHAVITSKDESYTLLGLPCNGPHPTNGVFKCEFSSPHAPNMPPLSISFFRDLNSTSDKMALVSEANFSIQIFECVKIRLG